MIGAVGYEFWVDAGERVQRFIAILQENRASKPSQSLVAVVTIAVPARALTGAADDTQHFRSGQCSASQLRKVALSIGAFGVSLPESCRRAVSWSTKMCSQEQPAASRPSARNRSKRRASTTYVPPLIPGDRGDPLPDYSGRLFFMRYRSKDCVGDHGSKSETGQAYGGQQHADKTHLSFLGELNAH
jgi:hypothetical protein